MEIARLNTQNQNYLWGAPFDGVIPKCQTSQQHQDYKENAECNKMLLVNNPDPSFQLYTGCLNPLDRDYWNARIDQRTFLIERPAVQHINRPQSTGYCNYRTGCPPLILTDPKLNQESQKYYQEFLDHKSSIFVTPEAIPRPNNLGLPTTDNKFCSAKEMCGPGPQFPQATYNQGTCLSGGCFGSDILPNGSLQGSQILSGGTAGRQQMKAMYDRCDKPQRYGSAVDGVKYNVESESALRRLDHYCPTDVFDSRVDVRKISQNTLDQAQVYIPSCVKPLHGIETPMVWRNLTKMRNRYLLEDIPTGANLSECPK